MVISHPVCGDFDPWSEEDSEKINNKNKNWMQDWRRCNVDELRYCYSNEHERLDYCNSPQRSV